MDDTLTPDLCIIGAGAGGVMAALTAARHGASVVLIERADSDGLASQSGMPAARAFSAAAASAHDIRIARRFGITTVQPTIPHAAIMEHVADRVRRTALPLAPERLAGLNIRMIRSSARFVDPAKVLAGDVTVVAKHTILAPGAAPSMPPIPGLTTVPYLTPETVWTLPVRPDHLVVLGAGAYALDLAQSFMRLGSRVTVLCDSKVLRDWDAELADPLLDALRDEGLLIAEGVNVERIERGAADGIRLTVSAGSESDTLEASHLLIAAGSSARTDGLGLDVANIAFDRTGIAAGSDGGTSNKSVSVIGDARARGEPKPGVATSPTSANAAAARAEGKACAERLARVGSAGADLRGVPRVVPTSPALAAVGLDEETARREFGLTLRVLRWPFSETDAAIADRREAGFVKVIATSDGRILGASILSETAPEMIHAWSVALSNGIGLAAFAAAMPAFPSRGTASSDVAALLPVPRGGVSLFKAATRLATRRR
jgi:pyruvate/2-oxoglutarate dehydrogenase complex dihydrolipoamide dehydrogenase (E3) component